jgi:hypothetical protein
MKSSHRAVGRLIYKALQLHLSPANDTEYRELLGLYRGDPVFAEMVDDTAHGLELVILDVSERGLIVAPMNKESRFSLRLSDLRKNLSEEQRVALVMAHLTISAVFYPTTDSLEDEGKTPLPANLARFRDTLMAVVKRLSEANPVEDGSETLEVGWNLLKRLPMVVPGAERASASSIEGVVRLALKHMTNYGLVRLERESEDDDQALYTPTHRLRVNLRELTLPRLFQLTREAIQP